MFLKALNDTMQHFSISAKELSIKSGIHEGTISRLRVGVSDPRLSTIENLLDSFPLEAKNYFFFSSLLSRDVSSDDIHNLLTMIACVIKDSNDIKVNDDTVNSVKTKNQKIQSPEKIKTLVS